MRKKIPQEEVDRYIEACIDAALKDDHARIIAGLLRRYSALEQKEILEEVFRI